jgi:hypothetical protein
MPPGLGHQAHGREAALHVSVGARPSESACRDSIAHPSFAVPRIGAQALWRRIVLADAKYLCPPVVPGVPPVLHHSRVWTFADVGVSLPD